MKFEERGVKTPCWYDCNTSEGVFIGKIVKLEGQWAFDTFPQYPIAAQDLAAITQKLLDLNRE